ncbi:MAG: sulfotransferase [Fidelibacterota bacterium]
MHPKQTQPILVTGSHRSGTTWVGKVLSLAPGTILISEPFAPNGILRHHKVFRLWFHHVESDDPALYYALDQILNGRYSISQVMDFKNVLPATDFRNPQGIHSGKFDYRYFPARWQVYRDWLRLKIKGTKPVTPILKDPIAFFSAPWLYRKFQTRNIILIRHPAAFVGSLKRMNWSFNFANFLEQSSLMKQYLGPFERQMREADSHDIIRSGALLWNCIHHVIKSYQTEFPTWYFLRHETLSQSPIKEFQRLFHYLKLPFDENIHNYIVSSTTSDKTLDSGKIHVLKRDSQANIKAWKTRLSPSEIRTIRQITEPLASTFYQNDDWE